MKKQVIVIVLSVQFLLACPPLNRPAAALERDQDPEQLWNIGGELSRDCRVHNPALRVKDRRHTRVRVKRQNLASLHQEDLLQELLPARDPVFLQELLVDASMP